MSAITEDIVRRVAEVEKKIDEHEVDITFLKETHRVIMHATNRLEESINDLNDQIKRRDRTLKGLRKDMSEIVELKNIIKEVVLRDSDE